MLFYTLVISIFQYSSIIKLCNSILITKSKPIIAPVDLILSSGFLAFARQVGMIEAIEDCSIPINRIVGTSSGSLAGSMYATGDFTSNDIGIELNKRKPVELLSLSGNIKNGLFSLNGLIKHLRTILPKDFKDLKHPLGKVIF